MSSYSSFSESTGPLPFYLIITLHYLGECYPNEWTKFVLDKICSSVLDKICCSWQNLFFCFWQICSWENLFFCSWQNVLFWTKIVTVFEKICSWQNLWFLIEFVLNKICCSWQNLLFLIIFCSWQNFLFLAIFFLNKICCSFQVPQVQKVLCFILAFGLGCIIHTCHIFYCIVTQHALS